MSQHGRFPSTPPKYKTNPFVWRRSLFPHVLVRRNDINDEVQTVTFDSEESASRFLTAQAAKLLTHSKMTPTEVQRQKLQLGALDFD